jgi:hypothetical protein
MYWWTLFIGVAARPRGSGGCRGASASGDAVAVCGFDDEAGGGQGGESLVESGGADAAGGT